MKVFIEPAITQWKGGVAAHDHRLTLAGHGKTEAEAVSALLTAVGAWCSALRRQEALEGALARAGIGWEDDANLAVEVAPVPQDQVTADQGERMISV